MVQSFVDKFFFALFVFSLIFVILLYKTIGFDYMDELCAAGLLVMFFYALMRTPNWTFNKAFLIMLGIFAFYTIYSVWIGSNSKRAIFNDLVIQMKPYIAFFCIYQLKPVMTESRKRLLRDVCLLFWFIFLLPIGLISLVNERVFMLTMEHPSYYGIAVTIVSLCVYYCSRNTLRDKLVFLLLLSIGIFCGRSKFFGFFILAVFMVLFFTHIDRLKLNLKTVMFFLCMLGAIVLVAWNKISFYFFNAMIGSGDIDPDMMARFVLYRTFPEILHDYFPFGSGFASYATHSSGVYYSDLYAKYGLEYVWGLSKSYSAFISDTFYPSLAQFGVVGIALFVLFWVYIIRKAFSRYFKNGNVKLLAIVLLIVGFLAIESTTGPAFIAQGGFFVMMMMGLILSEMSRDTRGEGLKTTPITDGVENSANGNDLNPQI